MRFSRSIWPDKYIYASAEVELHVLKDREVFDVSRLNFHGELFSDFFVNRVAIAPDCFDRGAFVGFCSPPSGTRCLFLLTPGSLRSPGAIQVEPLRGWRSDRRLFNMRVFGAVQEGMVPPCLIH